jgi:hypothetical protein
LTIVTAKIVPGCSAAYVGERHVLLVRDAVFDAELIELVGAGGELDQLLTCVGDRDFGIAQTDGSVTRVLTRGAVEIVTRSSSEERIAPTPELFDRSFNGLSAAELLDSCSIPASGAAAVEMWSGAAPASVVMWSPNREAPSPFAPSSIDELFGATLARSVEDAAVRAVDQMEHHQPLGLLVFSTGDRVLVDGPMLLGRNPERDEGDAIGARLVRLPGPGISRMHAAIAIDQWQAVVDDLGSLNGTLIEFPGRSDRIVEPGSPVPLCVGARVHLGDDVYFEVEAAA